MTPNANKYQPEPSARRRTIRIMLVDDDADTLAMFAAQPKIDDTLLVIKNGGFDALKALHDVQYHVDAIVTDLSMADIDGIRMTKLIRENEQLRGKAKPIDIYWLTGWPPSPTLDEAKDEFGVRALLEKPYDVRELIEKVRERFMEDEFAQ